MLQGKAVGGAILLILLGGCTQTGQEARPLANAPVTSSEEAASPTEPAAAATAAAPATAGARVFVDPVTGLQRAPTAEEWAGMVEKQEKIRKESGTPSAPASSEMTLPDGTRGFVLGDSAKTSARACKQADGTTSTAHDCPQPTNDATTGKAP